MASTIDHLHPDRSTACAIRTVSAQLSLQAFSTVVIVEPWLQLKAMTPSFMGLLQKQSR
jgi:hypothetical protein